ncbi:MAG: hypothetical protein H0W75_11565, partial [Chitinophagaceae bacterium]|nr:hypothetical protein [Chitinophagaceae bacterium]
MRKALILLLVFASATLIFLSCQKDVSKSEQPLLQSEQPLLQSEKILKAKAWFESRLSIMKLDSLFVDAKYDWIKAKTFTFKNGYEIITVPIVNEPIQSTTANRSSSGSKSNKPATSEFYGREILLIYPRLDGKGYF